MELPDLRGTVVAVTGGARGLGHSLASSFAAQGAHVVLMDILPGVQDSARQLQQVYGTRASGIIVDVTDRGAVADAFETARREIGVPQTLITAAGITVWNDSIDISAEEWRKVLNVNLDGTFFAAQAFARELFEAQQDGSAIFMSSMSSQIVNIPQNQASYNSSKAAVSQLGKSLAVEWAGKGIRVNAISPGYFLSDMTRQFTESNPQLAADWQARIPLGRMGKPEDLHGLVLYLASESSSYITGQNIIIDGGYTAI